MATFSPEAALVGVAPLCVLAASVLLPANLVSDASAQWSALSSSAHRVLSLRALLVVLIAGSLIAYFYRRWTNWRRVYELIEKIPGPPCHPIPFLGHAGIVLELDRAKFKYGTYALIYQMLTGITGIFYKDRIVRMWMGARPFVMLFTPEAVEVVLSSNTLTDKSVEYTWLKPWLGEGLVTSNKSKWKSRRKVLTPAFHFRILQDFLPIINEKAQLLVTKMSTLSRKGLTRDIDVLPLATLCTLDTICETAMGISVGCQENESDYVKCLHQVSGLIITRLTRPWLWPDWMFYLSEHGRRFRKCLKVMQDFTMGVIKDRKRQWIESNGHLVRSGSGDKSLEPEMDNELDMKRPGHRLAFLDLLLQHHMNGNLTLDDVREEVDTFMFAGHDTTAMAISWTLYMLGLHQDIQERVREEVDSVFEAAGLKSEFSGEMSGEMSGDGQERLAVSSDMLKDMKYLDCVLKEVQRVYPTAPFVGRELTEDTEISGYLVPKGTTCGILTFLLHRNPEIFPNPEVFDPERFRPDNAAGRHPFAYVPFSAGPRNCVGQKFALMEQKIVVANVLRTFHLRALDERDKLIVVGEMVLRPCNGLRLEITPRSGHGSSSADIERKSSVESRTF